MDMLQLTSGTGGFFDNTIHINIYDWFKHLAKNQNVIQKKKISHCKPNKIANSQMMH